MSLGQVAWVNVIKGEGADRAPRRTSHGLGRRNREFRWWSDAGIRADSCFFRHLLVGVSQSRLAQLANNFDYCLGPVACGWRDVRILGQEMHGAVCQLTRKQPIGPPEPFAGREEEPADQIAIKRFNAAVTLSDPSRRRQSLGHRP